MGAYWDELVAKGPLLLWKLNEASPAAVAADSSGNGRDGTISNLEVDEYGRASLVNSEPGDTCFGFNANNEHVKIPSLSHGGWMDQPSFTFVLAAKLSANTNVVRWLGGRAQIIDLKYSPGSSMSLRRVSFEALISGTIRTLNADASYPNETDPVHIMASYDGTDMVLWVNGVKYTANWPGVIAQSELSGRDLFVGGEGPLSAVGHLDGQGFGYYGFAFTDQDAADVYAAFNAPPNLPPDDPTTWVNDPAGQTIDQSFNLEVDAVTDPNGDAVEYRYEYSDDAGETWTVINDWGARQQVWDTSALIFDDGYLLRVKARDTPGLSESGYLTSGAFTIQHPSEQPVQPSLTMLHTTDFSVLLQISEFSDPNPGDVWTFTQWQIHTSNDFTNPAIETDFLAESYSRRLLTGFERGQLAYVRVRVGDQGGQFSEWSEPVEFLTTRLSNAPDMAPLDLGYFEATVEHGSVSGFSVSDFARHQTTRGEPGVPIWMLDDAFSELDRSICGVRLNLHATHEDNIDAFFNQNAMLGAPVHTWSRTQVRIQDFRAQLRKELLSASMYSLKTFAAFIAYVPLPDASYAGANNEMELWGIPNCLHFRITDIDLAEPQLVLASRLSPNSAPVTAPDWGILNCGGVLTGGLNTLLLGYEEGENNILGSPTCANTGHEAFHTLGTQFGYSRTSLGFVTNLVSGCGDIPEYIERVMESTLTMIDIGHGSSFFTDTEDPAWGAGTSFRGYIPCFVMWLGYVPTEAEHFEMSKRLRAQVPGSFRDYVLNGLPVKPAIFLPFLEPRAPRRPQLRRVGS